MYFFVNGDSEQYTIFSEQIFEFLEYVKTSSNDVKKFFISIKFKFQIVKRCVSSPKYFEEL